MCLLSKSSRTYVSKKPITCYKIVKWNSFRGYFGTIQDCEIPDTVICGSCNYIAKGTGSIMPIVSCYSGKHKDWLGQKYCTEGGFIHCVLTEKDAHKCYDYFNSLRRSTKNYHLCLFKVEVPAGVEYIKGINGFSFENNHPINGLKVIAAKEIKFIEKIEL